MIERRIKSVVKIGLVLEFALHAGLDDFLLLLQSSPVYLLNILSIRDLLFTSIIVLFFISTPSLRGLKITQK